MFNLASTLNKWRSSDAHSSALQSPVRANEAAQSTLHSFTQTPDLTPFLEQSKTFQTILDASGAITYANDTLQSEVSGSIIGQSFASLCHKDDRAALRHHIRRAAMLAGQSDILSKPPSFDCEARIVMKGDQTRWVRWHMALHNGMTYAHGRDITREKEQAKALARAQEQLIQAESIGRFGRWEWVMGKDTFDWSQELYRIFGQEPDSFTPQIDQIYAMLHEDDRDRMDQTLQRAVINQTPFDVDFSFIRADGQQRFIRCEGRCKSDDNGEVIMLYGIMQDISERVVRLNDLRSAKEAAEKACAARTQFLANMSHELRTPLNAIIGFSDMIAGEMLGAIGVNKYKEYAADISKSGAHLLDLISDILDMSKIEAGKYDLDREDVIMRDVIDSALSMIAPRAQEKDISLSQDVTFDSALTLTADRRACLQILLNVLSNAVKFTDNGGTIALTGTATPNSLHLTITDNGKGIPATKLASITQPFEQVSNFDTRDHEGSGLGLAITKELIEMQGGTLRIKSQIGQGTEVIITLPL